MVSEKREKEKNRHNSSYVWLLFFVLHPYAAQSMHVMQLRMFDLFIQKLIVLFQN